MRTVRRVVGDVGGVVEFGTGEEKVEVMEENLKLLVEEHNSVVRGRGAAGGVAVRGYLLRNAPYLAEPQHCNFSRSMLVQPLEFINSF